MLQFIKTRKKAFIMAYVGIGIVYSAINLPNLIRSAGSKKYLNITAPVLGLARLAFWPLFLLVAGVKKISSKKVEDVSDEK